MGVGVGGSEGGVGMWRRRICIIRRELLSGVLRLKLHVVRHHHGRVVAGVLSVVLLEKGRNRKQHTHTHTQVN